jgi:hypothetical protein
MTCRSSIGDQAPGRLSTRSCFKVKARRAGKHGSWRTTPTRIVTVDEHHCHLYVDGEKQPAEPLPFAVSDTNGAMGKIIDWFTDKWTELI